MPTYEKPQVNDYGTLVELTATSHLLHSDSPSGVPNTAFSSH